MTQILLVAMGGGAGAVLRYLVGAGFGRWLGPDRPWLATLAINVAGGLLMGLLVGVLARRGGAHAQTLRLLLGVGVLGGFTTFSTFSLEAFGMLQRRETLLALGYVAASAVMAVAAVGLGVAITRRGLA